jgi:hypothetical protein
MAINVALFHIERKAISGDIFCKKTNPRRTSVQLLLPNWQCQWTKNAAQNYYTEKNENKPGSAIDAINSKTRASSRVSKRVYLSQIAQKMNAESSLESRRTLRFSSQLYELVEQHPAPRGREIFIAQTAEEKERTTLRHLSLYLCPS